MELISSVNCFGGEQRRYKHMSKVLNCEMHFSLFLPPSVGGDSSSASVPLLTWLSGLTCTDENFVQKACAQRAAVEHGVAILAPDTSPRGDDVPDDAESAWDFGLGAGFYVNATQAPWDAHYKMYDYVVNELAELMATFTALDLQRQSIFGHSMGGHGALTIALKNQHRFRSVSAFAPICSPLSCPWGHKALSNYIGDDRSAWAEYDSCALIKAHGCDLPILVDQGEADSFLEEQLKTHLLREACDAAEVNAEIRMQAAYDHSYFFIASFMDEHIAFHAKHCG